MLAEFSTVTPWIAKLKKQRECDQACDELHVARDK
jgi:hypothetical protein